MYLGEEGGNGRSVGEKSKGRGTGPGMRIRSGGNGVENTDEKSKKTKKMEPRAAGVKLRRPNYARSGAPSGCRAGTSVIVYQRGRSKYHAVSWSSVPNAGATNRVERVNCGHTSTS